MVFIFHVKVTDGNVDYYSTIFEDIYPNYYNSDDSCSNPSNSNGFNKNCDYPSNYNQGNTKPKHDEIIDAPVLSIKTQENRFRKSALESS
jgi:hypothetical protein